MGGAAFIFASVVEPGVVHDAGGPGSIVFGELDGSRSARGEALLAQCQKAGIPAELVTDMRVRLWDKFAFICAQAGMTACTRLPIGEIRAVPATRDMFSNIVDEVVALGTAEGVDLPSDTGQKIARFAQSLPAGASRRATTTSSAVGASSSRRCTVSWCSDPAPMACRRR
jgi:2-dehydropantoate 2-reductase